MTSWKRLWQGDARDTFLFDLDNTLVDSSAVQMYRDMQDWQNVHANLHKVVPFDALDGIAPHEVPRRLKKKGFKIGIVTSSRRKYAEKVLKNFKIPYDVLVAAKEAGKYKPYPEPFLHALQKLGKSPDEAYSVGDDSKDAKAAYRAGVFPIGVTWGVSNWVDFCGTAPHLTIHRPRHLLTPDDFHKLGYLEEIGPVKWHRGTLLWLGPDRTKGFCLGRSYSKGDERIIDSEHTWQVRTFKESDDDASVYAMRIVDALKQAKIIDNYSYVVAVPPKRSGEHDRFGQLLRYINEEADGTLKDAGGLKCIRDYGSTRGLNAAERRKAVAGAFKSTRDWKGKRVILVDDIHTSGATTDECAKMMTQRGAKEVLLVCLAKEQFTLDPKRCECGERMYVQTAHQSGNRFWGCSSYFNEDPSKRCGRMESID